MAIDCQVMQATNCGSFSLRFCNMEPLTASAVLSRNLKQLLATHATLTNPEKLAARSGVAKRTIESMKRGEGNPTLKNIEKLAHAYKYTPAELLSVNMKEPVIWDDRILNLAKRIQAASPEKQELILLMLEAAVPDGEVTNAYGVPPHDDPPSKKPRRKK